MIHLGLGWGGDQAGGWIAGQSGGGPPHSMTLARGRMILELRGASWSCPSKVIEDILALIKTDYPQKVMCRKAEYHKTEYALEYKPI